MKTAAIYNVFDGTELLIHSMRSVSKGVDLFIIVWQSTSNHGELYYPFQKNTVTISELENEFANIRFVQYEPNQTLNPGKSEIEKRQIGLDLAKKLDCTHFLFLDCDELYENFLEAKKQYIESGCDGSVAPILTYFKKPTWRLENFDNYLVPFIHVLNPETRAGSPNYPHYVDPTRRVQCLSSVKISEPMHHFSWCRLDIKRKVKNSTAKNNILKSKWLEDYYSPNTGPGSYVRDYRQKLIEVQDLFNLTPIFSCETKQDLHNPPKSHS